MYRAYYKAVQLTEFLEKINKILELRQLLHSGAPLAQVLKKVGELTDWGPVPTDEQHLLLSLFLTSSLADMGKPEGSVGSVHEDADHLEHRIDPFPTITSSDQPDAEIMATRSQAEQSGFNLTDPELRWLNKTF